MKRILMALASALVCSAAIIPKVTIETSSDVPIAQIVVGNVEVAGLPPDGWEVPVPSFGIGMAILFSVNATCSTVPVMTCTEFWETQNGLPVGNARHHVSVLYEGTIPTVIPGKGRASIMQTSLTQTEHDVLDASTLFRNSGEIVMPGSVERGVPFDVVVRLLMEAHMWYDREQLRSAVYVEYKVVDDPVPPTETPEPATSLGCASAVIAGLILRSRTRA